jgi:hypothetical protein
VVRAAAPRDRALALAALPAACLSKTADAEALLRWTLLLVRPHEAEARDTWTALEAIATHSRDARIGVTVFGVRSIAEARDCFDRLAAAAMQRLGCALVRPACSSTTCTSRSIVTGRRCARGARDDVGARSPTSQRAARRRPRRRGCVTDDEQQALRRAIAPRLGQLKVRRSK